MMSTHAYPAWNLITLDRMRSESLQDQVFKQFVALIRSGNLPAGRRLASSRQLAEELSIARNTAVMVYARLTRAGYISQHTGSGAYVCWELPTSDAEGGADGAGDADTSVPPPEDETERPRLSRRGEELVSGLFPFDQPYGYDLSPYLPSMDTYPYSTFRRMFRDYWSKLVARELVFGNYGGLLPLREQIAEFLGSFRGAKCTSDQLFICSDLVHAATMSAMLLLDVGDTVIVEEPGFIGFGMHLRSFGLKVVPVRTDGEGLNPKDMDKLAPDARMVFCAPACSYPLGLAMSEERRAAVLAWASRTNAWIFENDHNSDFRWKGKPSKPLFTSPVSDKLIYASSFHRTLGPGFRIAYVVVPADLENEFSLAQEIATFRAAAPAQRALADFMKQGLYARHLRQHLPIYKTRAEALLEALHRELSDVLEIPDVGVGLQVAARFKEPLDDVAISTAALARMVDTPALSTYCQLEPKERGLVIGFGNTPIERIGPAVGVLKSVIHTQSK